ncbi:SGNH/GDSL hydrolase family protein [Leptospira semungkisensis]|uniref:SGNH/GDSL hydrolase family protein n=1 Tax=Leptospira semungkisensis TaxID=2484985 RepID=A0A4R9G9A2_9LEPT|nr:SGNH/GDSL hydrolase family protein [Leptospira semungkisensis]TGK07467.1 SGNH/GDSL hydrolase family protein [Leptospira semungkisensis]
MSRAWLLALLLFSFTHCYSQKDTNSISSLLPNMDPIPVTVLGDSLCERSQAFGLREGLGSNFEITEACVSLRGVADWLPQLNLALVNTPKLIIIELGLNDLLYHSDQSFSGNYNTMLSDLQSKSSALIMVTVLPPTNASYRTDILQMNVFLKSLGSSYPIADMETPFLQTETKIELYPTDDPIHPDPAGYSIMKTVYMTEVAKLFGL